MSTREEKWINLLWMKLVSTLPFDLEQSFTTFHILDPRAQLILLTL